jgi:hypothetical protein
VAPCGFTGGSWSAASCEILLASCIAIGNLNVETTSGKNHLQATYGTTFDFESYLDQGHRMMYDIIFSRVLDCYHSISLQRAPKYNDMENDM